MKVTTVYQPVPRPDVVISLTWEEAQILYSDLGHWSRQGGLYTAIGNALDAST